MYATLRDFLDAMHEAGELQRITVPVSPRLEIAEIADRQSKAACIRPSAHAAAFDPLHAGCGGRALLFEQVEGCDFPVSINVFGSYRRMELALGCAEGGFPAIAARLATLTKPEPPRGLGDLVDKARAFLPLLRTPPRLVKKGRCQQVVRLTEQGEVDLRRLPLIQCWPLDGDLPAVGWHLPPEEAGRPGDPADHGRYVTFAGMHTIHAEDEGDPRPASHNIGMYRAQLLDQTHLAMHWHVHHDGAAHWRSWKQAGRRMPIAICFGGESVMPYAATAPLPPGMSELLMAGFLHGRGIPLVRAKTVPLRVPANSEIVIEGWVSADAGPIGWTPSAPEDGDPLGPGAVVEGPFGDHTGFYSLPDRYPVVEVTAVTHAQDAVFPATIVGAPPQEDYYLGKATERVFLPLLHMLIPDMLDYHLPRFGCFHNCAFVQIRKAYPLQARRVMHSVWGAGQMAWTKIVVVVNHDVHVHDETEVLAAIARHVDFRRDLEHVHGPLDILDHAAPHLGAGGKLGIDATRAIAGEDVYGVPAGDPAAGPGARGVADDLGPLVGQGGITGVAAPDFGAGRVVFVTVDKQSAGQGAAAIERVWQNVKGPAADLVVAVDGHVAADDWEQVLFNMCAGMDPSRDVIRLFGRMGIDATAKLPGDERDGRPVRPFPPAIEMSEAIREKVASRWDEYGFDTP